MNEVVNLQLELNKVIPTPPVDPSDTENNEVDEKTEDEAETEIQEENASVKALGIGISSSIGAGKIWLSKIL